jgi:parallel beta-helix repeat protein
MSADERLERLLADVLDARAPSRPPDRLVPETLRAVRHASRWPRWLAFVKEPPMRVSSRVAVGSPTARITAILAATLLLAILATGAVIGATSLLAGPAVLVVAQDGSGTHTTLAAAVAVAEDGDTIRVRPGTYTEAVVIDEDLVISGDGPPEAIVIEAPLDGPTMLIEQDGNEEDPYAILLDDTSTTLSGITFRGERSQVVASGGAPTLEGLAFEGTGIAFDGTIAPSARYNSIVVNGGSTATVRNNVLTAGGPIGVFDQSSPIIEQNTLIGGPHIWGRNIADGAVFRGNTVTDAIVHGIGVFDGTGAVTIEANVISNPGAEGITAWVGTLEITDNRISGGGYGISTEPGADARIEGNRLTDNRIAIALGKGWARGNSLSGNDVGVSLGGTAEASGNEIVDGVTGIAAMSGSPTISGNSISGNGQGLVIGIGATPVLSGNTICDNAANLVVPDGADPPDTSGNEICADGVARSGG